MNISTSILIMIIVVSIGLVLQFVSVIGLGFWLLFLTVATDRQMEAVNKFFANCKTFFLGVPEHG